MAMTEVVVYGTGFVLTTIPSAAYMIRNNSDRGDDFSSAMAAMTLGLMWPLTLLLLLIMVAAQGVVWVSRKLAKIKH